MRKVMAITKNAIQATFRRNTIATAKAKNTIPTGKNAVLPRPFARSLCSPMW
jgi:hypothetical protein